MKARFEQHAAMSAAAVALALLPAVTLAAGTDPSGGANVPWYLSRATGLVAYLLLYFTVVLGLTVRTKALDRVAARWRITDVHTFLSALVVLFVAVHVFALLGDTFVGFSAVELLVPFVSPFLPVWTGLGIITAYLLLIVAVSFPARRLIGYRAWRSLHYLTFAVYVGALAHALFAGTDSSVFWAQMIYVSTAGSVVLLVLYRIAVWRRRELNTMERQAGRVSLGANRITASGAARFAWTPANLDAARRFQRDSIPALQMQPAALPRLQELRARVNTRAAAWGSVAAGLLLLVLLGAGITRFGWGRANSASVAGQTTGPIASVYHGSFQEGYSGTMTRSGGQGNNTVELQIAGTGSPTVRLELQLQLAGRQSVVANSATLSDANGTVLCSGQAVTFDNSGFEVDCQGAGPYAGRTMTLTGSIDTMNGNQGNQIAGTLTATAGDATG